MLPYTWRRVLTMVRILLGLSGLTLQLISSSFAPTDTVILFAAYTAYACVALFWRGLEDSGYPTLALLLDLVFFVLSTTSNVAYSYWVSAVFFAFVLLAGVMLHDWWKPPLLGAASVAFLYAAQTQQMGALMPALIASTIVASVLAIERQYLEERLSSASRQTVLYRYDAEKARESERQRIAADFHDGPLQSFISFQMRLEIIKKLLVRDQTAAAEELVQLQDLCKSQVNELRTFVRSMRPVDVDGSLSATLRRVVQQFQKDTGVPCTFVSSDFVEPAEPEVSLELLQIVREALYNVQKHSAATRVAVTVEKSEDALQIAIEDNGTGFPFSGRFSLDELELLRLGPASIKRRVRTLGGDLLLDSRPGQGAGLRIRLAT
ncbi:MAG: sensor histidine kinase [Acidobacteriota bacterium]|nr:sensor histidine kinase [Acidobacteriota bacterium]